MHTPLHTQSYGDFILTLETLENVRVKGNYWEVMDDIEIAARDFTQVTRETPLDGIEES